jgi:hypothetical protein
MGENGREWERMGENGREWERIIVVPNLLHEYNTYSYSIIH